MRKACQSEAQNTLSHWPDPQWWDVPLEWDLVHVQDQLSRWTQEQEYIQQLWHAEELHFLEDFRNSLTYIIDRMRQFLAHLRVELQWVVEWSGGDEGHPGGCCHFLIWIKTYIEFPKLYFSFVTLIHTGVPCMSLCFLNQAEMCSWKPVFSLSPVTV